MTSDKGIALSRLLFWSVLFLTVVGISLPFLSSPAMASDMDYDGLTDFFESAFGTDPTNADSDYDGLPDWDEIYIFGTDPTLPDTDGDGLWDGEDPEPLDDGLEPGGTTTPSWSYSENLSKCPVPSSTAVVGMGVNAISGEMTHTIAVMNLGPGYLEDNLLVLTQLSGVTLNSGWGRGVVCNLDLHLFEDAFGNVHIITPLGLLTFIEDNGNYIAPPGVFYTLTRPGSFELRAMRGGKTYMFDEFSGDMMGVADRFGNYTGINRNQDGEITSVDFPEGYSVDFSTYSTGRYALISDPARAWMLAYNTYDELSRLTDPNGRTKQFFYTKGSDEEVLNSNLVKALLPSGEILMEAQYDEFDRVTRQMVAGNTMTLSYSGTYTEVTDFSGNDLTLNFTSGEVVPRSLVQYSNRNVRVGDPASWTTTFGYTADWLRNKVVSAGGGRVDIDYNAAGCVTEIRQKATNTDTDNTTDHVSVFTYGSVYNQLEDSISPNGDTIERTLSAAELVTRIDYPIITHPAPAYISIHETMTWNPLGQLVTHTDGEGVVTRNDYFTTGIKAGLLWTQTRDYGIGKLNLVSELDYDSNRFLSSSTDSDNYETTFVNGPVGELLKVTCGDTLDYEIEFVYGINGYLTAKRVENVDETGIRDTTTPWMVTSYSPDPLGRPLAISEALLTGTRTTEIARGGLGEVMTVTLPNDNVIQQVFAERGDLASRTVGFGSAEAATEYWETDADLNLVSYVNARGKTYGRDYNAYHQLIEVTTPLSHYTSFVPDKNGNMLEIKRYDSGDTLLAHRKQHFDELGQLYRVEDWLDHPAPTADEWVVTSIDRNKQGLVEVVTDHGNHQTTNEWDAVQRLICQEDDLGNRTEYDFGNDAFVPTEITQVEVVPGGGTQSFVIQQATDPLHRITQRDWIDRNNSAIKHSEKWKRDFAGVAREFENKNGHKTYRDHNGIGMVTEKRVSLGGSDEITTQYGFDLNLNLISLKDDAGNETLYVPNARDQIKEIEYDDGKKRTFTLLADGSVGGWTDENGTVVTNTVDDDGRLTARAITPAPGVLGPTSETYGWDGMNRLLSAGNDNSTVIQHWNSLSQLVSETQGPNPLGQNGKTISYGYGDCGERESCEYFSGYQLAYRSDAIGRWDLIEDGNGADLVSQSFYGAGFRSCQVNYLNGTQTTVGYDGFRNPTDIDHVDSSATTFAGFDYGFDQMHNPLWVAFTHNSGKGNLYAYDPANRLISAQMGNDNPSAEAADGDWVDYAHVQQLDFNMDEDSNRDSVVTTPYNQSPSTESYVSDSLNQYTSISSVVQTHDDNGNLTSDGTLSFGYDYMNNLVLVSSGAIVLSECQFDPFNRRTVQVNGPLTVKYFYDGVHVVEEYDGSDNLLKKFVYGQRIDEIRVMIAPDYGDVDDDQDTQELLHFYYHHDMLGTVTHVTDENEEVVESYEYTPYGQTTLKDGAGSTIGDSAIGNPYMFTARRMDESTGLYHYRRRAYDSERGRFLQRDPLGYVDGMGLHLYVSARPTAFVDPSGWQGESKSGDPDGDKDEEKEQKEGSEPETYTVRVWVVSGKDVEGSVEKGHASIEIPDPKDPDSQLTTGFYPKGKSRDPWAVFIPMDGEEEDQDEMDHQDEARCFEIQITWDQLNRLWNRYARLGREITGGKYDWHAGNNCVDYVLDILAGCGIEVGVERLMWPWWIGSFPYPPLFPLLNPVHTSDALAEALEEDARFKEVDLKDD